MSADLVGGRAQRLHLQQQRAGALQRDGHGRADAGAAAALAEEHLAGVLHRRQPLLAHRKHAHLCHGTADDVPLCVQLCPAPTALRRCTEEKGDSGKIMAFGGRPTSSVAP